jgi:hypothetical protein
MYQFFLLSTLSPVCSIVMSCTWIDLLIITYVASSTLCYYSHAFTSKILYFAQVQIGDCFCVDTLKSSIFPCGVAWSPLFYQWSTHEGCRNLPCYVLALWQAKPQVSSWRRCRSAASFVMFGTVLVACQGAALRWLSLAFLDSPCITGGNLRARCMNSVIRIS